MSRLPRFEGYRFIGTRDTMRVYDCDDEAEFDELRQRVDQEDLGDRLMLQSFAPDNLLEARNRGFHAVPSRAFSDDGGMESDF